MASGRVLRFVLAVPLVLAAGRAGANCSPPKTFSQIGLQYSQYVLMPPGTYATNDSVVGKFWQPANYVSTNQGSCHEWHWLVRCYDCNVEHDGPVYYVEGILGEMSCLCGCPQGQMIVLVEDRKIGGAGVFAVGRVTELIMSFPRFDFSRIEVDWTPVPIPKPTVFVDVEGSQMRVAASFADPKGGFFGLPGAPATSTITAFHLYTWVGISPPAERQAWTHVARFAYTGGVTTGSANIFNACPDSEVGFRYIAGAIELDSGQVITHYVSEGVPVSCTFEIPGGAGRVAETGPDALTVSRSASGDLTLAWGAACAPAAPTYEIYQGALGAWDESMPLTCGLNELHTTFPEPLESAFYLVVPYANRVRPPNVAGSYGLRGDGSERPPSPNACRPQWIVPCPP